MTITFNESKQEKRLQELRAKEAEDLARILADKYNLLYIDLSKLPINTDALRLITETEAKEGQLAAFKAVGKKISIALVTPANQTAQRILKDLREKNFLPELYLCSIASLERAFSRYNEISHSQKTEAGIVDIANEEINEFLRSIKNLDEVKKRLEEEVVITLKEGGVTALLEIILAGAIYVRASDIHVEPQEKRTRLRYRLDGVLNDFAFFDNKIYRPLLSRVKLIAGLKLNIKNSAQDGRFSIKIGEHNVEVRVSILPGAYGESIVFRLLDPQTLLIEFPELGLESQLYEVLGQQIAKPNGLILLTGPTGSGKTTTLYAILNILNKPETKIITIEDPIEYHLTGINQTQVNPAKSYTFLSGLRSALRQDPDIIMVGEIRDEETARIAVNASLTGHLVLSTIHTNNAVGTIPRLIDLGVNPKIIESALNIALAQRLVRRLCPDCREEYTPEENEKKLIEKIWEGATTKRPELKPTAELKLWQAKGCKTCHQTGFRGRVGIFEAIVMDSAVAKLLDQNPNERELKLLADKQKFLDLAEDGIIKVVEGITTLAELKRVVDLSAKSP